MVMVTKSAYIVDGLGMVPRLKGLHRDDSGAGRWIISPNNDNRLAERMYFHDSTYGNEDKSYIAAVKELYRYGELFQQGMRRQIKERKDKNWKTGQVGVCVRVQHRGHLDYYTIIATPIAEQPGCIAYAGNEETKDKYFEAAMRLCKDHRTNSVHKYVTKRRVKLRDAMPWSIPGIV